MKPSETIISFIKSMEGCRLKSYLCPAGVMTIGYGTTHIDGKPVTANMEITMDEADEYCRRDIAVFVNALNASIINKTIIFEDTYEITYQEQNQFDAFVSFSYNLGVGNLLQSTLIKRHNAKDFSGAATEFLKWRFVAKKALAGLTCRRCLEAIHYFLGMNQPEAIPYIYAVKRNSSATTPVISFQPRGIIINGTNGSIINNVDAAEDDADNKEMGSYYGERYQELKSFFEGEVARIGLIF